MANTSPFGGEDEGSIPSGTTMTKKKIEQMNKEISTILGVEKDYLCWEALMEIVDKLEPHYSILINPANTGIFDKEDQYNLVASTVDKKITTRKEACFFSLHMLITTVSKVRLILKQ